MKKISLKNINEGMKREEMRVIQGGSGCGCGTGRSCITNNYVFNCATGLKCIPINPALVATSSNGQTAGICG
jgi:natural product precursor